MDEASQVAEADFIIAYFKANPSKLILTGD